MDTMLFKKLYFGKTGTKQKKKVCLYFDQKVNTPIYSNINNVRLQIQIFIQGPKYLNIILFKYSCSSLVTHDIWHILCIICLNFLYMCFCQEIQFLPYAGFLLNIFKYTDNQKWPGMARPLSKRFPMVPQSPKYFLLQIFCCQVFCKI